MEQDHIEWENYKYRMTIRLARPHDAPAILAIYAPIVLDTPTSFEYEPPTSDEMANRIAKTIERYAWIVAERDGDILGYAYGGVHRARPAYQWNVETSVYVAESARGQGVGRRLYEALLDICRKQGFRQALAGITLPNPGSVALHEAVGFRHFATFPTMGYKFGAWHDVGWWHLYLSDETDLAEPRWFPCLDLAELAI